LVDFATHARPLIDLDIRVVAGSVDSLESVQTLRAGLHIGFPMWGELNAAKVSADTGAPFHDAEKTYLHGSAWLVNPDGEIVQSLISTGPIGRFTASDIIRKVQFERAK
jgi:alkyl hydroperoxide reductase subunit AhpC